MATMRRPRGSQFDLFDMHTVQGILDEYNLGNATSLETLIIDDGIIVNLMDRSETSKKVVVRCGTSGYFLKQVPWYCDNAQQLNFALEFERFLNYLGFLTPKPIETKKGVLFSEYGNAKFVLYELMHGTLYSYKETESKSAAETLASLHMLSRKWQIPENAPQSSLLQIINEHLVLAEQLAVERNEYTLNKNQFKNLSNISVTEFSTLSGEIIPVHGDYIPWNLGYKENKVGSCDRQ